MPHLERCDWVHGYLTVERHPDGDVTFEVDEYDRYTWVCLTPKEFDEMVNAMRQPGQLVPPGENEVAGNPLK